MVINFTEKVLVKNTFFSRRGDSFPSQAKFCVLLKFSRLLQIVEKNVQNTEQMLFLSKILTIDLIKNDYRTFYKYCRMHFIWNVTTVI